MDYKNLRGLVEDYGKVHIQEKKKLDPVDKDELDSDFDDREDKDIDNDGDIDSSDEYLHKRRKAVSKSIKKEDVNESVNRRGNSESESMEDRLTASDKKFIDAHGVKLSGQPSEIDGQKAADFTAQSIKNSEPSVSTARPGDKNIGDKSILNRVKEATNMSEIMGILSEADFSKGSE